MSFRQSFFLFLQEKRLCKSAVCAQISKSPDLKLTGREIYLFCFLGQLKLAEESGGYDKHVSFDPLAAALCERAKAVILTGATAQKIKNALDARPEVQAGSLPIYEVPLFADAVCRAREIAERGDTVLLSPACASFDVFNDFADRGDTFRRLVNEF